jgi:hypothetical protein
MKSNDKNQREMNTHYYQLPDGRKADNMKEACELLNIPKSMFKRMRQHNLIKRVEVANSASSINQQTINNDGTEEDNNKTN